MNNIDILEEKEKEAIKDLEEYLHWEELQGFSMLPRDKHIETLLNLVETLIAENKELKEDNEYLKSQIPVDKIFYYSYKDFIPKSKVKEVIEEVKEDENPSISSFQEYAQEYAIDKLQSLLGKE